MHLLLDVLCRSGTNRADRVSDLMLDVVRDLGLHVQHLHIQEFPLSHPSGPGISGVALISESHLNIHTWPEHRLLQLCLHSCREFDASHVKDLINRAFGLDEVVVEEVFERTGVKAPSREGK